MSDEERDVRTDFLVARPSFWSGVGRVLDLWGKFDDYNISRTTEEADMRALYSDWRIVGQDLRDSWLSYHQNKPGYDKKKRKDGRFVCSACGKVTVDSSAPAASLRDRIRRKAIGTP